MRSLMLRPKTICPPVFTAPPDAVVAAALTVGAALVIAPVTVVATAFTVGAALVAAPVTVVAAAFTVGAAEVAAPDAVVAAALGVSVAALPPHAASTAGTISASSAVAADRRRRSVRFIVPHSLSSNTTGPYVPTAHSTVSPDCLAFCVPVTIPANLLSSSGLGVRLSEMVGR